MSWKNYLPVAFYLVLSQFFVMYIQSPYLVLLFFIGYLAISSPLVINIFRNIILEDDIKNSYIEFFKKIWKTQSVKTVTEKTLSNSSLWGQSLAEKKPLIDEVTLALKAIYSNDKIDVAYEVFKKKCDE